MKLKYKWIASRVKKERETEREIARERLRSADHIVADVMMNVCSGAGAGCVYSVT